ncbi:MAG: hypothetical protein RLZZ385_468 [Pseudomonadota bacterium]
MLGQLDLNKVRVFERDEHCISRRDISPQALKVLYSLGDAGYQAFLVGGSVRDLLLGNRPKDFDIATDATPEELKRLFRNSRIIGRRFKIVHIHFGREIIEVTTFRAHHTAENEFSERDDTRSFKHLDSAHSSSGMILRDNVYGDINEDAVRRDFTVNALYYTVDGFRLLDFTSGMEDIRQRLIRVIGDPATRYKEDPVRMLRAIRLAAKLDFSIEPASAKPINELAGLLESVSPARLFDESLKLFSAGYGETTLHLLQQFKVGNCLIPATLECLSDEDSQAAKFVFLALRNTDARIREEKSVTPAFLFAALLWPVVVRELRQIAGSSQYTQQDLLAAANHVIGQQLKQTAIPRRFTTAAREIWELQLRMARRNKRSIEAIVQHPRFRAAYDFLLLREESGEDLQNLGAWWTKFQTADEDQQQSLVGDLSSSKRKRRRPRKRRPAGDSRT